MPFLTATGEFGSGRKRQSLAPPRHFIYEMSVPYIFFKTLTIAAESGQIESAEANADLI